jgi:hypothetical protein
MQTLKSVPNAGVHATYFFPWELLMEVRAAQETMIAWVALISVCILSQKLRSFSHADHYEWGAGQTDEELITRARKNLKENKGWFNVDLQFRDPSQNDELHPYTPDARKALLAFSERLYKSQEC